MKTERFHLGVVLSMITGKRFCEMEDIHRIATHLAGRPMLTHELGWVRAESRPHLLAQFPALAGVTGEGVTPDNFAAWLSARVSEHGEWLDVAPLPAADAHESVEPARQRG